MMNTWIAGAISGIIAVFVKPHVMGTYTKVSRLDCCTLCNGILCGLVSITGCCDCVEPYIAFVIGVIAALVYILGCKIMEVLRLDDAVEAVPVHLFGGIWGTLATGLFGTVASF
jgi:Amt family ammonium transporter